MTWASSDNRGWQRENIMRSRSSLIAFRCNEFFNYGDERPFAPEQTAKPRGRRCARCARGARRPVRSSSRSPSATQKDFQARSGISTPPMRGKWHHEPTEHALSGFRGRDHFGRLAPTREAVKVVCDGSHAPAVPVCLPRLEILHGASTSTNSRWR